MIMNSICRPAAASLTRRMATTHALHHHHHPHLPSNVVGVEKQHRFATFVLGAAISSLVMFKAPAHDIDNLDPYNFVHRTVYRDFPADLKRSAWRVSIWHKKVQRLKRICFPKFDGGYNTIHLVQK